MSTPLASSASERDPERRVHDLAVWSPYWALINAGQMRVMVCRDDCGHRAGDVLILREWDPNLKPGALAENKALSDDRTGVTGQVCHRQVTHVLRGGQFGLAEEYVALSLVEESPVPGHMPCVICGYARSAHGTGRPGMCNWFDGGQS